MCVSHLIRPNNGGNQCFKKYLLAKDEQDMCAPPLHCRCKRGVWVSNKPVMRQEATQPREI